MSRNINNMFEVNFRYIVDIQKTLTTKIMLIKS